MYGLRAACLMTPPPPVLPPQAWGLQPFELLMVGDSMEDIETANAAGTASCLIAGGEWGRVRRWACGTSEHRVLQLPLHPSNSITCWAAPPSLLTAAHPRHITAQAATRRLRPPLRRRRWALCPPSQSTRWRTCSSGWRSATRRWGGGPMETARSACPAPHGGCCWAAAGLLAATGLLLCKPAWCCGALPL